MSGSSNQKFQRIILISEIFYPEDSATAHILTKIAGELAHDFDLLILTGSGHYEGKVKSEAPNPLDDGKIKRLWVPNFSKNNLFGRLARFLILTIQFGWQTFVQSRSDDIVFAVSNPAPLVVVLAIIRKIRRCRLVFLVHDVFPENAVAAGVIDRDNWFYLLSKKAFDWAYGSADIVVSIGRDMSEVLARKIPNRINIITLIENWSDYPLIERISRDQSMIFSMGLSNKIVIQYAGNIGRTQGLLEFVNLIAAVKNNVVRYVFRGSGALLESLREATSGSESVILEGSYPRSQQGKILNACDISLVILAPGMYGLGVPSKTYNILAAGKPVLFLGPKDSEVYRLIKSHNIGWAFDWGETHDLIKLISKWSISDLPKIQALGDNARNFAETSFTEEGQLAKFRNLFCGLQQSSKRK